MVTNGQNHTTVAHTDLNSHLHNGMGLARRHKPSKHFLLPILLSFLPMCLVFFLRLVTRTCLTTLGSICTFQTKVNCLANCFSLQGITIYKPKIDTDRPLHCLANQCYAVFRFPFDNSTLHISKLNKTLFLVNARLHRTKKKVNTIYFKIQPNLSVNYLM